MRLLDTPEFNIALFAFLLNLPWEFWQVPFFAGMPRLPLLGTGMLPVLQWIVIPPLVLWFVKRQVGCTVGAVAPEHREGRREV